MKTLKKFWNSVKRNPVVLAFLLAVATQVFQDWQNGKIDWTHFWGYLVMVFIAVGTREFTVPAKDHEELKQEVAKAVVATSEQFAGWVSPEDHDKAILHYTKKAEELTRAQMESELMDPHFKKGGYSD